MAYNVQCLNSKKTSKECFPYSNLESRTMLKVLKLMVKLKYKIYYCASCLLLKYQLHIHSIFYFTQCLRFKNSCILNVMR